MFYDKELAFFRRYLKNLNLNSYIAPSDDDYENIDLKLRKFLKIETDYSKLIKSLYKRLNHNTIYKVYDSFLCNYIVMILPDTVPVSILIIGPYAGFEIEKQDMLDLAQKYNISPQLFQQFEKYYSQIPVLHNESDLFILLNTFGEIIWGNLENFSLESIKENEKHDFSNITSNSSGDLLDNAQLSVHILEARYESENKLIRAVSQGLANKAEMLISKNSFSSVEKRTSDPVRNMKNYTVILNTLLRKAAEQGSVHPYYIDGTSSDFARRIEMSNSIKEISLLQQEMVRSYCKLVKNHSMKNYSPLIQKVLTRVDSELTSDLSLKVQAKLLNINPSYLSSLFKKETGMTLTDYVNKKRAEHAALLLKTTSMQIQTIAQYCGILDVNYFTKIFKKYFGKTPKEYRESL